MADKARNATDRKLSAMEKQIEKIYSKSTKEITEKWQKYMDNAEKRVSGLQKEYDDAVKRGDKDEIEQAKRRLDRAKYNETITNARYKEMVDQTTTRMANANIIAAAYVNGQLPEVYVLNYNQMGSGADAMGVSYTLLDENTLSRAIKGEIPRKTIDVPKDKRWNEKYINSQVTQGIIQGESMDKISKRIFPEIMSKTDFSNLTEEEKNKLIARNRQSSIRAARTMVTGVENLGRLDGMKQLEKEGVLMKKIWTSTPDDRTRESHIDIDGEEQNLDDYFSNGCMFPGDGEGPAEEVWNCRCSMRRHIIGIRRKDGTIKEVDYKADSEEHDEAIEQERERREQEQKETKAKEKKLSSIKDLGEKPVRPKAADFDDYDKLDKAREEFGQKKQEYQESKEQLIENWLNQERDYQTREDAEIWAKENNVKIDESFYTNIDPKLYDDIIITHQELFERYPEVKGYYDDFTMNELRKNPNLPDIMGQTEGQFIETYSQYDGWNIRGETLNNKYDCMAEANHGIAFSDYLCGDAHRVYSEQIDQAKEGFTVEGDGTFRTVVTHEFGHNVDEYIRYNLSKEEQSEYTEEVIRLATDYGSEYSRTNEKEAFAEGFAEYNKNPNSEYGRAFGEFFERWYNAH